MRRSLVNIRQSDIRSKPYVKKTQNFKRQRTLTEFQIPVASSLPIRKRDGLKVIINDGDTPIVLDEDEIDFNTFEGDKSQNIESQEPDERQNRENVNEKTEITEELEMNETLDSTHITNHAEPLVALVESQESVIEIIESDKGNTMNEVQKESFETEMSITTTPTTGITHKYTDQITSIKCPICDIDISGLELYAREAHCEQCFDVNLTKVSTNKMELMLKSSPKKQLTENNKKETKLRMATKKMKKKKRIKQRLPLPSIKILNFKSGYKLVVDGFNFAPDPNIDMYFLSHFHSDHYMGINKSWDNGRIFCSIITSQLLQYKFKVPAERIFELENDTWIHISDHIEVMAMDANHCPGASIFLFREWDINKTIVKQILHTGDFRVTEQLTNKISNVLKSGMDLIDGKEVSMNKYKIIDEIYLDTTYLNVGNSHPTQNNVITTAAQYIKAYFDDLTNKQSDGKSDNILDKLVKHRQNKDKKNIVLVGSYSIGKEKLAQGIAEALNYGDTSIYIRENDTLRKCFIPNGKQLSLNKTHGYVDVHIVPLNILKDESKICEYIKRTYYGITWLDVNLIGIIPTGWTFSGHWSYQRRNVKEKAEIVEKILNGNTYGDYIDNIWFETQIIRRNQKKLKERGKFDIFNVPYSEHSSFPELIQFLSSRDIYWKNILPTVNLDKLDDMREWFETISKIKEDNGKI
ncbi:DNA cross-link repair protein PSO2 PWA37_004120 [Arxiozyma heterogenica]|uniref:DNA repair metallo-beta-lactamase domain-containing protein n=1 Tax=Arxiozyma heterogenica TaxID=278026 RepID=A0AAN7W1D6_9SACH|nr:hypothetical protein RI543_003142 [Kazachstania heterogenica]